MIDSAAKTARYLLAVLTIWLASTSSVWAQAISEEPEGKTYVPSYMIVMGGWGRAGWLGSSRVAGVERSEPPEVRSLEVRG
jgi:hypothetical protein